jgi:hypothetical protein
MEAHNQEATGPRLLTKDELVGRCTASKRNKAGRDERCKAMGVLYAIEGSLTSGRVHLCSKHVTIFVLQELKVRAIREGELL